MLILVPLAALSTAGLCGGGSPPKPDRCDGTPPMVRGPLTVEIGGRDTPFRALSDGEQIAKERGPQGGEMVPYRIRVSGGEAPTCLEQTTTLAVEATGEQLAKMDTPLRTYPEADGARATQANWLILAGLGPPSGTRVRLTASVAGVSVVRTLRLVDFIVPDEDLAADRD
jgi:hypothetical protein